MWFRSANSHTGRSYGAAHRDRTDDCIRLRADLPRFTACIRRGVHRRSFIPVSSRSLNQIRDAHIDGS
jgi:hypothetical protein